MRSRAAVLTLLAAVLGVAALPVAAGAAPHRNHGLTIAATPNPIITGEGVLIHGQLNTSNPGVQTIVLYHRVNPSSVFTVIGRTKTTSTGLYEFIRAENVVLSNRSWFVRAPGLPGDIHSRTVHERVAAAVSLATPTPPSTGFLTGQQIVFTGAVAPDHAGARVLLQRQSGALGNTWKTIKVGRLDGASHFSISGHFAVPGDHTLRVFFPRDERNIAAVSDSIVVVVQQKEKADFTITTSNPIIAAGGSATVNGIVSKPGTTTPDPSVMVTLWGHIFGQAYAPISTTTTAANGGYSFTVTPQHNEIYQVRTSFAPQRASAQLFEGVQDLVSVTPSSTTSTVGQSVTFTGSVFPAKPAHMIELQRLGADGHYHVVAVRLVNASSVYQFKWTFGTAGTKTFRVHIPGGPDNIGGYSSTVAISVALPALQSLPPAS